MIIPVIITAIVALGVGAAVTVWTQRSMAHSRAKSIIEEARIQADSLKKDKIREGEKAAEKLANKAEKAANQRMQKVQSAEARAKQRELQLVIS